MVCKNKTFTTQQQPILISKMSLPKPVIKSSSMDAEMNTKAVSYSLDAVRQIYNTIVSIIKLTDAFLSFFDTTDQGELF